MKFSLRRLIRDWLHRSDHDDFKISMEEKQLYSQGMTLQIYRASGGFVIETRHYDRKKDQTHNNMYVVTEDQDLGEHLGKIVMMEALQR